MSSCIQKVFDAIDVRAPNFLPRHFFPEDRREVVYGVNIGCGPIQGCAIAQVSEHRLDTVLPKFASTGEISHKRPHIAPLLNELRAQAAADETRCACDQHSYCDFLPVVRHDTPDCDES
jgi:hypothetical protein